MTDQMRVGDIVIVKAKLQNYRAVVEWCSPYRGGKATVRPLPDQGMTDRARGVWQVKVEPEA